MRRSYTGLILLNLLLVAFFFIRSLLAKEAILQEGKLVLLELAPVDPRSLMQGDYMELSYAILRKMPADTLTARGFVIMELDEHGVGHFLSTSSQLPEAQPHEVVLPYYRQRTGYSIGAESFFFEEGQAELYQEAVYGGLRIDRQGNSVLVGLYDSSYQQIRPQPVD